MAEELLEKLRQNDQRAQQALRKRLGGKVLSVCLAVLKDPLLAEETAEDIWMDFLYQHVGKIRKEGAVASYLRMMTVRRCTRLRAFRARHEEAGEQAPLMAGSEAERADDIDRQRQATRLAACLKKLSRKVQKIFRMRYRNDLNQEQIGKAVGVSRQYVGRVLNKGLGQLHKCMEGEP